MHAGPLLSHARAPCVSSDGLESVSGSRSDAKQHLQEDVECRGGWRTLRDGWGQARGVGQRCKGCLQPGDRVGIGVASDELAAEQQSPVESSARCTVPWV